MPSEIETLLDLLTRPDFWAGFVISTLLAGLLFVNQRLWGRPGWALALAGATVLGIHVALYRRIGLAAGVALIALGGFLIDRYGAALSIPIPLGSLFGWSAVGIGAVLVLMRSGMPEGSWMAILGIITALIAGWRLRDWAGFELSSYLGIFAAVVVFGIWTTVPETETARVLLGAVLPLSAITFQPMAMSLATAGSLALPVVFSWVAVTGGETRPSSVLASLACLGLLAITPRLAPKVEAWKVLLVFAAIVIIFTRTFGLWESTPTALLGILVFGSAVVMVARRFAAPHD